MEITHIVLLKIKDSASQEQIDFVFSQLKNLKDKIPGIASFECGTYDSHEGLNHEFNYIFRMVFCAASYRDAYLPHPEHEVVKTELAKILTGFPEGVMAFDYTSVVPVEVALAAIELELSNPTVTSADLNNMLSYLKQLQNDIEENPTHYVRTVARRSFNNAKQGLVTIGSAFYLDKVKQAIDKLEERIL